MRVCARACVCVCVCVCETISKFKNIRDLHIIHENMDMPKLSAKWVPKCMNADQKRQRCQSSEQFLEFFRRDPNDFLSRLVTMDETWSYHHDPETKQQ